MTNRIHNFSDFSQIFEGAIGGSNIIIGDSLCPLISKHVKGAGLVSNTPGEASLWKPGMGVKWLKNAVSLYPVSPAVKNVIISIGTNGGFNPREDITGLISSIKTKFQESKITVIQGSWGWGGNRGVTEDNVRRYYSLFSNLGVTVIEPPVGFSATDREAHSDRPVLATIGNAIDQAIQTERYTSPTRMRISPGVNPEGVVTAIGIIARPGDPYKYKVENDHWLAKKDVQPRWYEITGADFKPQFQPSIDTLDSENPSARSKNAPKRSGTSNITPDKPETGSEEEDLEGGILPLEGKEISPEKNDPKISEEFNFHLIPDKTGTNYRSAQFPEDIMKNVYSKYGIKNVIRLNGDGKDGKHKAKYESVSIERERQIAKDLGINFYKLSATKDQDKVNEILLKGNTLIHCAHGADRTGGNVGGYFYDEKVNPNRITTEQIWKYTTQYNGWNNMALRRPKTFTNGYLQQAQKFGVEDLEQAQALARKD
jgi:hypothetical protein